MQTKVRTGLSYPKANCLITVNNLGSKFKVRQFWILQWVLAVQVLPVSIQNVILLASKKDEIEEKNRI